MLFEQGTVDYLPNYVPTETAAVLAVEQDAGQPAAAEVQQLCLTCKA